MFSLGKIFYKIYNKNMRNLHIFLLLYKNLTDIIGGNELCSFLTCLAVWQL